MEKEIEVDTSLLEEQFELIRYTDKILKGCIEEGSKDFIIEQYKRRRDKHFQEALEMLAELYPKFPKELIEKMVIQ